MNKKYKIEVIDDRRLIITNTITKEVFTLEWKYELSTLNEFIALFD